MIKETIYGEYLDGSLIEIYFSIDVPQMTEDELEWGCSTIIKFSDRTFDVSVTLYNITPTLALITSLKFVTKLISSIPSLKLRYTLNANDYIDPPIYPLNLKGDLAK